MAGAMGYFVYNSDDSNAYKMKLDASNAAAAGATAETGGVSGTDPWYPRGWQGRYLLCQASGHPRRKVVACDPSAAVWVGSTNTIDLEVVNSAAPVTFHITGRIGEKRTARG